MNKRNIVRSVLVAELVLFIPLIAMQFTAEVNWEVGDFIVAGILLAGIGFAYQLIMQGIKKNTSYLISGILLITVMLIIWVELAVGIFD